MTLGKLKSMKWGNFGFEFLSIFIAVVAAFALNNWNDNRKDKLAANKILTEIYNGVSKDLEDVANNVAGHQTGLQACDYFRKMVVGQPVSSDSLLYYYFNLTRDYISIQNIAGYETLKSKGLELIRNDSLRLKIISLYEYDYSVLRKLEEEYGEMQFHTNYFKEINDILAPHLLFKGDGNYHAIKLPLQLLAAEKSKLLLSVWKIQINRNFILNYYAEIENKITAVKESIEKEISPI